MNRTSLICAALVAAAITLISVGGSVAHPTIAVSPGQSVTQTTLAAPTQPSSPDVIVALSDLVDLERTIKATSQEEREKFKINVSRPAVHDRLG